MTLRWVIVVTIIIPYVLTLDQLLYKESIIYGISAVNYTNENVSDCTIQLWEFAAAAENRTIWALKIIDSSAHSEDGFLWGNNLWVGRQSECYAAMSGKPILVDPKNPEYRPYVKSEFTPFEVEFYSVFGRHNSSLQQHTNLVKDEYRMTLGLCLPSSCHLEEIMERSQLYFSDAVLDSQDVYKYGIKIVGAKSLNHKTNWLGVTSFQLLLIIVIITGALTVIGTTFDSNLLKSKRRSQGMYSHGVTNAAFTSQSSLKTVSSEVQPPKERLVEECQADIEENTNVKLLLAFSLPRNTKKLLSSKMGKGSITCLNGIRFLSMFWVIFVHAPLYQSGFTSNRPNAVRVSEILIFQPLTNGSYSVDSFLFLSGFLLAYLYFKNTLGEEPKHMGICAKQWIMVNVKRYLRLTPTYIVALVILTFSFEYYSKNSVFEMQTEETFKNCETNWWRNLLYVNNLYPYEDICFTWTWYLSVDTQYFLLASGILFLTPTFVMGGLILMGFLIVACIVITAVTVYELDFIPYWDTQYNEMDSLYTAPLVRIGPYLVGVLTGYLVAKLNGQLDLKRSTIILLNTFSTVMNLSILLILSHRGMPLWASIIYMSLSRTLWGVGLSWMVIACSTGNAPAVNNFLSWKVFVPLSRMCYAMYLLNPYLAATAGFNSEKAVNFGVINTGVMAFSVAMATILSAFAMSLFFEMPVTQILNAFFGKRTPSSSRLAQKQEENTTNTK